MCLKELFFKMRDGNKFVSLLFLSVTKVSGIDNLNKEDLFVILV